MRNNYLSFKPTGLFISLVMEDLLATRVRFDGSTLLAKQCLAELEALPETSPYELAHRLGAPVADVERALGRLLATGLARPDFANLWSAT